MITLGLDPHTGSHTVVALDLNGIFRTLGAASGRSIPWQHSRLEQLESGPSVYLTLDRLESIDMSSIGPLLQGI